jgi:cysteine desulfurase
MNNLSFTQIHDWSRRTGTVLTNRHYELLDYVHGFYEKHRVGPLFPNLKRHMGATKEEIETLFPNGLNSLYMWVGIRIINPSSGCKPMATVEVSNFREVYLDHNATTYVRDEIRAQLMEHLGDPMEFGNASSSTTLGNRAHHLIQEARQRIANCLDVEPSEIVFTGCGSEANNFGIKGLCLGRTGGRGGHIVTSSVEHSSVLESVRWLEQDMGFEATYLPVDADGRVSPEQVREALRDDTMLVSIMAVNNEIGVINPLEEIGAVCRRAGVPLMVDAIQGFGKIDLDPKAWGISVLTISGHKIYAPKGVAAMYIDRDLELAPLIHGGAQEHGRRAGTENVAFISALGLAAKLMHEERRVESQRLATLRDYFLTRLHEIEPRAIVNGSLVHRVAHNLNIGFPGIDSGALLLSLNQMGVYVSSGSACHAGATEASHVIRALGVDTGRFGTIRFSFGLRTTREEMDYLFEYLGEVLQILSAEVKTPQVA